MNKEIRFSSWVPILFAFVLASCATQAPVVNPKFDPAALPGKSSAIYSDGFFYYCAAGANYYDADETIKINEKFLQQSSDYLQTKGYKISSKDSAFVLAGARSDQIVRISVNGKDSEEKLPPLVVSENLKADSEYSAAVQRVFQALYTAEAAERSGTNNVFERFAQYPELSAALMKIREKAKADYSIFIQSRERRDTLGRALAVGLLSLGMMQANCRFSQRAAYIVDLSRGELLWKSVLGGSAEADKIFEKLPSISQ